MAQVGDPLAIRRERGAPHGAGSVGHPAGIAAVAGHNPHVRGVVFVTLGVPCRGERQGLAVRRPHRPVVVVVPVGELVHAAVIGIDHEQMGPAIVYEPFPVHFVLERGNDPRRPGKRLCGLLLLRLVTPHARQERQPLAVRRPHGFRNALRLFGQSRRFTAVGRHDIQLRTAVPLSFGHECQPPAVRRPARPAVSFVAAGQTARLAAVDGNCPDVRQVGVAFLG